MTHMNIVHKLSATLIGAAAFLFVAQPASAQVMGTDFVSMNQQGLTPVTGNATVVQNGNQMTVTVNASGLEPNQVHAMHIHGFDNMSSYCPSALQDTNNNDMLSLSEGANRYGPIILPLKMFPTADAQGNIYFSRTFTVSNDLMPLNEKTIVLHGMTKDGMYWPTAPVACGEIKVQ